MHGKLERVELNALWLSYSASFTNVSQHQCVSLSPKLVTAAVITQALPCSVLEAKSSFRYSLKLSLTCALCEHAHITK